MPSSNATTELTVMISGGFALAYQAAVPDFARETGISVQTLSGASQGQGPKTIRHQLANGAKVDVVILSNEGLHELIEGGWVAEGSAVELATAPLAAAVRTGAPKPDIATVAALTRSLREARLVVMPGSTSGLFILNAVIPRLGLADTVRTKVYPRGTDSAAALAAGEADLALGPISELVNVEGIEPVGLLPDEVQLVQTFSAAILARSLNPDTARQLIAFLSSERTKAAISQVGMEPVVPN
jgi:molybdate transport system substrate-binding protein